MRVRRLAPLRGDRPRNDRNRGLHGTGYGSAVVLVVLLFGVSALSRAQFSGDSCLASGRQPVLAGGTSGLTSLYVADLNGDGGATGDENLDIVTASFGDDSIRWFENDGGSPPLFTPRTISTNADGASAVFVADVDGDGNDDVLSASANDNKIAWYRNNGDTSPEVPQFTEFVISTNAQLAQAVHAADLDGDGDMDVLSASFQDDKIAWYKSDGAAPPLVPEFTEVVISENASGAAAVWVADINGDMLLDVISGSRLDGKLAWYLQVAPEDPQDDPTFEEQVIPFTALGVTSVIAADIDGDMDIDVASASANDNKIAVFVNLGPVGQGQIPAFTQKLVSQSVMGARAVFAEDLDADGDLDLLSASSLDNTIAWYENLGVPMPGSLPEFGTEQIITEDAIGARDVFAADLDDDGSVDVQSVATVAGSPPTEDSLAWYQSSGGMSPMFTENPISMNAQTPESIFAVNIDENIDGDTDLDVVTASSVTNTVAWQDNDGNDPPGFTERIISTDALGVVSVFADTINSDAFVDVLSASPGNSEIAWYRNDGMSPTPGFTEVLIPANAERPVSVFAIDLDGDGDQDVLSASELDNKIAWYENTDGEGTFSPEIVISIDALGAAAVYAADVDQDGDNDVLSASQNDNKVVIYLSNLSDIPMGQRPTFAEPFCPPDTDTPDDDPDNGAAAKQERLSCVSISAFGARSVTVADLVAEEGSEQYLEVFSASANDSTVSWYRFETVEVSEQPFSVWVERTISRSASFARWVSTGDVDNDGLLDVLSASSGDDTVAIYLQGFDEQTEEIVFSERTVADDANEARAALAGDVNGDGIEDVISAFFFEVGWHEGGIVEACQTFDADMDNRMDGAELGWFWASFTQTCTQPPDPMTQWWCRIDYNDDGTVDGDDLAILTSLGVWGKNAMVSAESPNNPCQFTCVSQE